MIVAFVDPGIVMLGRAIRLDELDSFNRLSTYTRKIDWPVTGFKISASIRFCKKSQLVYTIKKIVIGRLKDTNFYFRVKINTRCARSKIKLLSLRRLVIFSTHCSAFSIELCCNSFWCVSNVGTLCSHAWSLTIKTFRLRSISENALYRIRE